VEKTGFTGPLSLLMIDNLTCSDIGMPFTVYPTASGAGITFPMCNALDNVHNSELCKRNFQKSAQVISSSLKTKRQ